MSPSKRKCFGYISNSRSWAESESQCQGYHGHLAALTSFQELTFVQKLCGEVTSRCWIGGRGTNSTADVGWRWSDNTSYWNETIIPQMRFRSSCNNMSCQNDAKFSLCSLTLVTNGTTSLMAEQCNMPHAYICMTYIGMQLSFTW